MDTAKAPIMVIQLVISLLIAVTLPTPAIADVTYTYTGNPFTYFTGPTYPPIDHISGSFTLTAALPDNSTLVSPLNYGFINSSFTDGISTFTNTNSTTYFRLFVSTDAFGAITAWEAAFTYPAPPPDTFFTLATYNAPNIFPPPNFNVFEYTVLTNASYLPVYQDGNENDPGVWSVTSTSPAAVPEPATMYLLGSGLLGLIGLRRRFKK